MPIEQALADALAVGRGGVSADRLCEVCVELLDVDAAAISLVFDGANTGTWGASSAAARVLDEMQFTYGEGPCRESVAARTAVLVPDLAGQSRWPAYSPAMLEREIHGVYAMPVTVGGEYVGALDLFRRRPGDLDRETLAGALAAAGLAEAPLRELITGDLPEAGPGTGGWQEFTALTRVEVSQATGMVVAQLDVEPSEALVRIRAYAYANDRSATAVARDILDRRLRLEP